VSISVSWPANVWYRIKPEWNIAADSFGLVPRQSLGVKKGEPDRKMVIEVPHKTAHQSGSPGLSAFRRQGHESIY